MALPWAVVTTSSCRLLLIYRLRKDERLSWASSGWFTHISGHLSAAGRAQNDRADKQTDIVQRNSAAKIEVSDMFANMALILTDLPERSLCLAVVSHSHNEIPG